ncbi:hypothetical protein LCGC14_1858860 [marine sediment metagenome]|uniref:Uncharacterized protein n=1 Tax=marine sediment metagenome TaxID=412755 RepID=A0A0F9G8D6_9ZZZZ
MMYLQDYREKEQTKLFEETGTFFAFSKDQFNEQKEKKYFPYLNCGAGMMCPKINFDTLMDGLKLIREESVKQDIEENGIPAIIKRELNNHECFYTGSIKDAVRALKPYEVDIKEVQTIYSKLLQEIDF